MSVSTSSPGRNSSLEHQHQHRHHKRSVSDGSAKGVNEDYSALFQPGVNRNAHLFKLEHDRSLQELDEAVASADRYSGYYSAQVEDGATDTTSAVANRLAAAAAGGASRGAGGNANCPLELRRVKSGQSTKSSHSNRSGRSKRSIRNSSRKRGSSLEREISQTILKTATDEEPHFITSTAVLPDCITRSAHFILSDLFNDSSSFPKENGSWQSSTHDEAVVLESPQATSPFLTPESVANQHGASELPLEQQYDHSQDFLYTVSTQSTGDAEETAASLADMQPPLPPRSPARSSTDFHLAQAGATSEFIENEEPQSHQIRNHAMESVAVTVTGGDDDDIFGDLDPAAGNSYEHFELAQSPGDMRIDVIKEEDEETDANTNGESTVGHAIDTKTTDGTGTLVFSLEDEYCLPIEDSLLQYSTTNGTSERSDVSAGELPTSSADERDKEIYNLVKRDANDSIISGASAGNFANSQGSAEKESKRYQYYVANEGASTSLSTNPKNSVPNYEHVDEKKEDAGEDVQQRQDKEGDNDTKSFADSGFEAFGDAPESWTTFDGTPFSHDNAFAGDADDAFLPFDDNVFDVKNTSNNESSHKSGSWKRRSRRSKLIIEATTAYESPKPAVSKSPSPQSPSSIFYFNSNVPDKNAANAAGNSSKNSSNTSVNTSSNASISSYQSNSNNSISRRKHKLIPTKKEQWRIRPEEVSTKASF